MIYRWKHTNIRQQALGILHGIACIADGLVVIFTLGFYASAFELHIAAYRAKVSIKVKNRKVVSSKTIQ